MEQCRPDRIGGARSLRGRKFCWTSVSSHSRQFDYQVPHGAVVKSGNRELLGVIRILDRKSLVYVNADAGTFTRMQLAVTEFVGVWKHKIRLFGVPHVLLNAEVRHPQIEVQGRT